jgi:hypothetical protein
MTPYEIQRGREITPENWNAMVQQVRANTPKSGSGYTVDKSPAGWALRIARMASSNTTTPATVVCPFEVTTANVSPSEWKFKVEWGLIGGKIPIGMYAGGEPPLIMPWEDGWVCAYVTFVTDRVTVDTVNIVSGNTDIPENTVDGAYYPLAYLHTDSTDPENPVQVIDNMCTQPVPSVCDLVFSPPA